MNKNIIPVAKTFLGTPWHHLGRSRKGLDCAGLIVETLKECGLSTDFDLKHYERIPDGQKLAEIANAYATPVFFKDIQDGDILLFNVLNQPQHLGFYFKEKENDYFIHAYGDKSVNKVVSMRLDSKWKKRIVGVYRVKGIE